ncbi:MAG: 50S ribosomal protein L1, partial [Opitutales bacterium]
VRVIVFTEDPDAAMAAGAEVAGLKDLIQKIQEGWLDFDVAISTTEAMKEVRTIARVLGPKGLMPNPKSGTVTDDVAQAIQAVKAGRVEFKMDKTANIGVVAGKRSFSPEQIVANAAVILQTVVKAKPESVKGAYIQNVSLSNTMSPSVQVDYSEYLKQ